MEIFIGIIEQGMIYEMCIRDRCNRFMAMRLISTRTGVETTPEQAVLCGLAPDGGLFVPAYFPQVSMDEIESYSEMPYAQVSARCV